MQKERAWKEEIIVSAALNLLEHGIFLDVWVHGKFETIKVSFFSFCRRNTVSRRMENLSSNIGRMGIWRPVLGCVESCNLDSQFSGRVDFGRESTIKTSYCRYIVDLHEESEGVVYAKIEFIIQHKANNGTGRITLVSNLSNQFY
ncbi:unnamed protein product [Rhizophagus irregularis]|nr:unnamed protein product [Rhizophagus irregularis]